MQISSSNELHSISKCKCNVNYCPPHPVLNYYVLFHLRRLNPQSNPYGFYFRQPVPSLGQRTQLADCASRVAVT